MGLATRIAGAALGLCLLASGAQAAPYNVLWWDSTPDYSGQAADRLELELFEHWLEPA